MKIAYAFRTQHILSVRGGRGLVASPTSALCPTISARCATSASTASSLGSTIFVSSSSNGGLDVR